MKQKNELIEALLYEIDLQKDYLQGDEIQTVYFGGGTPSLLTAAEINQLFVRLHRFHTISPKAEITLEANPDDLTPNKLKALRQTPINRLSIGVQSFFDEDLKFMNRTHNAIQATTCIADARQMGFDNLTIDLIYGAPTTQDKQWQQNLEIFLKLDIPHLSSYCLTIEPGTALAHFVKTGKAPPINEARSSRQLEYLMKTLKQAGYLHYEISNFAKKGFIAQHNSNYWLGQKYLGLGPSAHSFNCKSRQWNIAHNIKYIKSIKKGEVPFEREKLSTTDQYNEYIMTNLRTMWGCNMEKVKSWGTAYYHHFKKSIKRFVANKTVEKQGHIFRLTDSGRLLADNIAMELFMES